MASKITVIKTNDGDRIAICVALETGLVIWMQNTEDDPIDFTIPKILPNGTRINALGCGFCMGSFKSITVSDNIAINRGAFLNADAESIILPPSCTSIPDSCFCGSNVKSISGLGQISEIGELAFKSMNNLNEIDLSESHVVFIGPDAFDESCIVRLPYYYQ